MPGPWVLLGCARCVQTPREAGGLFCGSFKAHFNPKPAVILSIPVIPVGAEWRDLPWGDKLEEQDLLGLDMEFPGLWQHFLQVPWKPEQ